MKKALPGSSDEHELEHLVLQETLLMLAYPSSLLLLSELYHELKISNFRVVLAHKTRIC